MLEVGNKRKFSFATKKYEIKEIIDEPNISMWWTWDTGVCPHCKEKIEQNIQHHFYRIEILAIEDKKEEYLTEKDIVIMGFTLDRKYMMIPKNENAYKQVLEKSQKFKKFLKEVI